MSQNNQTGKAFWRSLDDLADSPRLREWAAREFKDYAPQEVVSSPSRRAFMKLMGASLALAGVTTMSGCRRWPERKLAPYIDMPEDRIPGVPEMYASVFDLGGVARPILVSSFEGRPTKIEGNPSHPASGGAADAITQASVLDLWDPSRSRNVLKGGKESSWSEFAKLAEEIRKSGGAGLNILSAYSSSPSMAEMKKNLKSTLPNAEWFEYESVNRDNEIAGAILAFDKPLRTHYHLAKAEVIVSLDGDPLGNHPDKLRLARDWAAGRRDLESGRISRMYVVEPGMTITGANADVRIPVKRSAIASLTAAIERGVNKVNDKLDSGLQKLTEDLLNAKGKAVVIVGEAQPPEVHAAAHRINAALGAIGTTVSYSPETQGGGAINAIKSLIAKQGVETLLILGGNPVFDAPADVKFADFLSKVKTSIHLSGALDETSSKCAWHLPAAHYLEAWGDARAWDGSLSIQQPLIQPLWGGKSALEVVAMLTGDKVSEGYDIVRRAWSAILPKDRFEKAWRKALHDGVLEGSAWAAVQAKPKAGTLAAGAAAEDYELNFAADYCLYDGRFAGNGWLQEMPDPVTKLTWDNAALMGKATADKLGVRHGDTIRIETDAGKINSAVFILPGVAKGAICMALGYGRGKEAGHIGAAVGFNVSDIRTSGNAHSIPGVKATKLGGSHPLATTQEHHMIDQVGMKERELRAGLLIRTADIKEYQKEKEIFAQMPAHFPREDPGNHKSLPLQIWQEPITYDGYKWGMAIDLNACIGCGACMVACQAENNIPIVGKENVIRGREMHWIRVDRYFTGDIENPQAAHQPMTCHQCENAPCESVCPVAATVHDSEGVNVMVYNRCVGTRYCANNCPYKVRRFNYFDWHVKDPKKGDFDGFYFGIPDQQAQKIDPVRRLGFNPDVTVRMRGVMEKCTFCTQRIKAKTIPAKNAGKTVEDGQIVTACQQTCPTQAISFGDLNDKNSKVAKAFSEHRTYEVLEELNVRARVKYLARVTNSGVEAKETKPAHGGAEAKHG